MIKGITIQIDGETQGLTNALKDINKESRKVQTELNQIEKELKFDPSNIVLLTQKQELLAKQTDLTEKKLKAMRDAQKEVNEQFEKGKIDPAQYRKFQREIGKAGRELRDVKEAAEKADKAIDEVGKEARESAKDFEGFGDAVSGALGGLGAGVGIAGTIATALESSSLDTSIDIAFNVPEESKASIKAAVRDIQAYGVDAESALEGVRRQFALNADASDESNLKIIEGAGAIARAYNQLDFTELIQETNEIASELKISNEEALGLLNSLLKLGFPPEQVDTIAEYGGQLTRAGFTGEQVQAIFAKGVETKNWNIDNFMDGLKEGRIRIAEFGEGWSKSFGDLLTATDQNTDQWTKWGQAVAKGGDEGAKAMVEVAEEIMSIEDATQRNALGVQVFGTMWEDQGDKIAETLIAAKDEVVSFDDNAKQLNDTVERVNADPYVQLQKAFADLKTALEPVITIVAEVVTKFAEWVSNNPQLAATLTAIATVVGILVGVFMALAPVIYSVVQLFGFLSGAFAVVSGWFASLSALAPVLGTVIGALSGPIGWAILAIGALIAVGVALWKNWDTVKSATSTAWNTISQWVSNAASTVSSAISKAWNNIVSWTSSTWSNVVSTISTMVSNFVSSVSTGISNVVSFFSGLGSQVMSILSGIDLFSVGSSIITGLINGIKNAASTLFSEVSSIAKGALNAAKSALGINSPSKLFRDEVGKWIPEGMAVGIEKNVNVATNAVDDMVSASVPTSAPSVTTTTTNNSPVSVNLNYHGNMSMADVKNMANLVQNELSRQLTNTRLVGGAR